MSSDPLDVIGDPEIEKILGTVAATDVTVPLPVGALHVPSPRQNVLAEALVPEFKFETGKLVDSEAALPLTFTWSPVFVPLLDPLKFENTTLSVVAKPNEVRVGSTWSPVFVPLLDPLKFENTTLSDVAKLNEARVGSTWSPELLPDKFANTTLSDVAKPNEARVGSTWSPVFVPELDPEKLPDWVARLPNSRFVLAVDGETRSERFDAFVSFSLSSSEIAV
jgi:hypothetical protein